MRARVLQSLETPQGHDQDPTHALAIWVGTVGGSALPTDPDPNVTPPSNNRILRCTAKRGALVVHPTMTLRVVCPPVAASSITFLAWYYDDTQARWIPLVGTSMTPTGGASNIQGLGANAFLVGAKVFVQITANALVQAMGYEFV
jgi:hypothetical protein